MDYLGINLISNMKGLWKENRETLLKQKGRLEKMEKHDVFLAGKTNEH